MIEVQPTQSNVIDNRIFYYQDEVTFENCHNLVKELYLLDKQLQIETIQQERDRQRPIYLHIQTWGGVAWPSFSVVDAIRNIKSDVVSVISGGLASAGTIIGFSANKRIITKNSVVLIHQHSGYVWGRHDDMKDHMIEQEIIKKTMIKFYSQHSNLSKKKVKKLLKRESWLTPNQCLKMGFVDEII